MSPFGSKLLEPRRAAGSDEFISGGWGGYDLRKAETISPLSRNERGETKRTRNLNSTLNATREARQPTTPDCPQGITSQPIRDAGRTSPPIMVNDG